MKKELFRFIAAAFFVYIATFGNITECAAAPLPKITVLTAGIGQKEANLPEDIIKLCEPIVIDDNSSIPDVEFIRIDLAKEKPFVITIPSSWTDLFLKSDPKLLARKKCKSLARLKITEDFSDSIKSDMQQIEFHKKSKCNGLITFEVTDKISTTDVLSEIQKQVEQDVQDKKNELHYCVAYKLTPPVIEPDKKQEEIIPVPHVPEASSNGLSNQNIQQPTPSASGTGNKNSANKDLFGIIEIGASGIKPVVLQVVEKKDEDRYNVEKKEEIKIKDRPRYDIVTFSADNRSAFHPDSIKFIAEDVGKYVEDFKVKYSIPIDNIYIVGSSSVAQVEHREELVRAVQDSTDRSMDFLTAEQEGKLVFNSVLKLIPKERGQRDRREDEVVVIDIGSGNIKGGYFESVQNRIITFELPHLGTREFSARIEREQGSAGFAERAKELRDGYVRPAIRSEAGRVPGLKNKKRVYLLGGIVWATSTLLSLDAPEYAKRSPTGDQKIYTVMNFDGRSDADIFYNRLIGDSGAKNVFENNQGLELLTGDMKEKRRKDIASIRDGIFTVNQLIGGTEILRALSFELEFKSKHVFFIQNALYGWPIGYAIERIERKNQ